MPDRSPVVLDPIEQRVLGSLLEKQITVPASYPLSLTALRTACNQATSREPVTAYDDDALVEAVDRLKQRGLARVVWAGSGSRVLKYHQLLTDVLELEPAGRALVTVLLLRGPQSAGELRTRTERLHPFADKSAVEEALRELAGRPVPIVREAGRRPGRHDARWIHLLGPVDAEDAAPAADVDRESVLAAGAERRDEGVRTAYDALAEAPGAIGPDLAGLPLDRWLLDRVSAAAGGGPVADLGCGRGRTTAYLTEAGVDVVGSDMSPATIAAARADHPGVSFEVGDFGRLLRPRAAAGWAAITAWYAFVHLAPSELAALLPALVATLVPGGVLAFAVQLGAEVRNVALPGDAGRVDVVLFDRAQVLAAVTAAGGIDVEWYVRGPVGDEDAGDRLYVYARSGA
ncbi:DUF480 domain-containing protein [Propionicicella superfundia]|uniref:DUF480 domain-containing protein n=1 Tax=Propionicicella superfundia TaxID=348582 RepID=UPI0003F9DC8C|nr:DUF480 domain-containing protein [Propionicicella superfundia]